MKLQYGKRSLVVIALVASLFAVWGLRLVWTWADRTAAFLALAALLAGFVLLLDWFIASFGPDLWRLARSVGTSTGRAVRGDTEVRALVARHPRAFAWLGKRLTRERPGGLYATVTAFCVLYFLSGFVSIAMSLSPARAITNYDPRILALVRVFRTPTLTRLLWVATVLADSRVILLLAAAAALVLVMWGRRAQAALLGFTLAVGVMLESLLKLVFHRGRPPLTFALIKQPSSFSFPSGHAFASLLLAVVIVFVIWRTLPRLRARLAVLFLAGLVVVAVGFSRIYLGVHWMSDVVASWSLALAWFSAACGGYLALVRYRGMREVWPAWSNRRFRNVATLSVLCMVIVAVVAGARVDPLLAKATAPAPTRPWIVATGATGQPAPTAADLRQLPIYSEKLDGSRQEPIGIVFIGTRSQLTSAFMSAGWQVADNPSFASLARTALAAVRNQPYPTAPVTPTFLGGTVQDIAFERPEGAATVRRRHHARFWQTNRTLQGLPVWVATASLDSRLEIGSTIPLPTHHIDPNIDAEQKYIVDALIGTDGVALVARVGVTQPSTGTNAQGDPWFTQGYASVLRASGAPSK